MHLSVVGSIPSQGTKGGGTIWTGTGVLYFNSNTMNDNALDGGIFQNGQSDRQITHKDVLIPKPVNVTLHSEKNFANVIKLSTLRCKYFLD